jgi:hypothetical protein
MWTVKHKDVDSKTQRCGQMWTVMWTECGQGKQSCGQMWTGNFKKNCFTHTQKIYDFFIRFLKS